jgi:predicted metal-dependent peptidase
MNDTRPHKNTICQTDAGRIERLYNAVEQFEYSPELAKRVYHLGVPYFTDSVSTASLTVTEKGKPVLSFNRTFFDGLGPVELVFVILHEVLHLVLRHHLRCHNRQPILWNIATDLVTNSFLLKVVGFKEVLSRSFHKFLESAVTFANLPIALTGDRLLSMTAEAVYDLLAGNLEGIVGKASHLKACDEHTWLGSSSDGGSDQDEPSNESPTGSEDADKGSPNDQGESSCLNGSEEQESAAFRAVGGFEQNELLNRFAESAQRVFRDWLPGWGNTPFGELRAIGEVDTSSDVDWAYILSSCIATHTQLVVEERWAPPNRKIAWLYPKVLLPAVHQIERYQSSVLMAIDGSGSVTQPVLARLIGVARGIPADRVELTAVSFDTRVYPVNIWANAPAIRGGGGTNFQAVENFARQFSRYPDMIIVLTDGFAPKPSVQHPSRWFWLITKGGTVRHIEGVGRYCRINRINSVSADSQEIQPVSVRKMAVKELV